MPVGIPKAGKRKSYKKKSKYEGKLKNGQSFGYWTVVDDTLKDVSMEASVLVRCVCGTTKLQPCRRLLNGDTKSCSCMRSANRSVFWKGTDDIPGRYYRQIVVSAQKRGLEWGLTKEQLQSLLEVQEYKCALSGMDIGFTKKSITHTASLDRIDSSIGYVEGNVQWVHKYVNISKNTFTNEEYIQLCKRIYDYNRDKLSENVVQFENGAIGIFKGAKPSIKG